MRLFEHGADALYTSHGADALYTSHALAKVFSKAPVVGLHQRTYDGPHRLALGLGERDGDAAAVGVSLGDVLGALQAARKRLEERRAIEAEVVACPSRARPY